MDQAGRTGSNLAAQPCNLFAQYQNLIGLIPKQPEFAAQPQKFAIFIWWKRPLPDLGELVGEKIVLGLELGQLIKLLAQGFIFPAQIHFGAMLHHQRRGHGGNSSYEKKVGLVLAMTLILSVAIIPSPAAAPEMADAGPARGRPLPNRR